MFKYFLYLLFILHLCCIVIRNSIYSRIIISTINYEMNFSFCKFYILHCFLSPDFFLFLIRLKEKQSTKQQCLDHGFSLFLNFLGGQFLKILDFFCLFFLFGFTNKLYLLMVKNQWCWNIFACNLTGDPKSVFM